MTLRRGTGERHHHQVEVHRERIHHHHFDWLCADDSGHVVGQQAMVRHPGITPVEMRFHSELCPSLELLLDVGGCSLRLKSERVSAKVDRGGAVRPGWNM